MTVAHVLDINLFIYINKLMSEIISCEEADKQNLNVFSDYNEYMETYISHKQNKFNEFARDSTVDISSINQDVYNNIVAKKNEYYNIVAPALGTMLNNKCCSFGKLFNKHSQSCIGPIIENNYKTFEGSARNAKVKNVEDCKKICNTDNECGGFNYDKLENTCSMYTQDVFKNPASYSIRSSGVVYDSTSKPSVTIIEKEQADMIAEKTEQLTDDEIMSIMIIVSVILFILLLIGIIIAVYMINYKTTNNSARIPVNASTSTSTNTAL
jgi:hypothetical protein